MKIIIATAFCTVLCLCSCRQTDDMELPTVNKTKKELLKKGSDSILVPKNLEGPTEPTRPPKT